ncbi:uncharacterized protein F5891DRAFT_1066106 [Suillus fuscotomentosus]|uniref:Uncharacterized protein n=1 Tax=Suillus fuscotomentosus TaxID=1912939 RepID=A0AAD4DTM6_9AGAM|nr:uncharacterized protein F5891DRAFT_1066106 [Suillus fuscotomentosus]KAG1893527.1 hypothetical protein F5891DRAFT_1066106 [Suillus fuscotomentosus]
MMVVDAQPAGAYLCALRLFLSTGFYIALTYSCQNLKYQALRAPSTSLSMSSSLPQNSRRTLSPRPARVVLNGD